MNRFDSMYSTLLRERWKRIIQDHRPQTDHIRSIILNCVPHYNRLERISYKVTQRETDSMQSVVMVRSNVSFVKTISSSTSNRATSLSIKFNSTN